MTDKLEGIFARQLELQRRSFGVDPAAVAGVERHTYLLANAHALVSELVEAMDEANWKTWTHGAEPGTFHDRDAFVRELVDMTHFLVNLFLLAGCDASEVYDRYVAKANVNAHRQETGYDGRSNKDDTGRALDEPDI